MDATWRSFAIWPRLLVVFLYRIMEVREVTSRPAILESWLMTSSVIPSLKYSFSGSALRLVKGNTATVLLPGVEAGES